MSPSVWVLVLLTGTCWVGSRAGIGTEVGDVLEVVLAGTVEEGQRQH